MSTPWEKRQTYWKGEKLCKQCQQENHGSCPTDPTVALSKDSCRCDCPKETCTALRIDSRAEYLVNEKAVFSWSEGEDVDIAYRTRQDGPLPGIPWWFLGLKALPTAAYKWWDKYPKCVVDAMVQWWGRIPSTLEPLIEPYTKDEKLQTAFVDFLRSPVELKDEQREAVKQWCLSALGLWHSFERGITTECTTNLRQALLCANKLPRGTRLFQGRGGPMEPANEKLEEGKSLTSVGPWSTAWHPLTCMNFISGHSPDLLVIDIDGDDIPGLSTAEISQTPFETEIILPVGCTVHVDKIVKMRLFAQYYPETRFAAYSRNESPHSCKTFDVAFVRVTAPPK